MIATPLFAAPFRPFYGLGAAYGALLTALAGFGFAGLAPGAFPMAWHGHEMVFGFAMAIIAGTLLTALPTWAGSEETSGARLALLAACWIAGRIACALAPALPWTLVAACDLALPVALLLHLLPQLLRLRQRRWLGLAVVLSALAAANLAWHAAAAIGDANAAARALRAALWVVLVLYTLAGGLFTPVFTANVLAARGRGAPRPTWWPLEGAALLLTVAAAAADVSSIGAPGESPLGGALGVAAATAQAWRVLRWRGWHARGDALVAAMHLGFAWLVIALFVEGAAHLGVQGPLASWVHAFTAGALGSMMLGLMTRVVLRHTGRDPVAPRGLPLALIAIAAATALRMAAPSIGPVAWTASALLWAAAMGWWWLRHAPLMLRESLPRARGLEA